MLQDTVERACGQIVAGLAGDGDATLLRWMLVLAMASARGDKQPSIFMQSPEHLADLHAASVDRRLAGQDQRRRESGSENCRHARERAHPTSLTRVQAAVDPQPRRKSSRQFLKQLFETWNFNSFHEISFPVEILYMRLV